MISGASSKGSAAQVVELCRLLFRIEHLVPKCATLCDVYNQVSHIDFMPGKADLLFQCICTMCVIQFGETMAACG